MASAIISGADWETFVIGPNASIKINFLILSKLVPATNVEIAAPIECAIKIKSSIPKV